MKKIISLTVVIICLLQTNLFSQNNAHPTIDKLEVSYKIADGIDTINMVRSQSEILLKSNADVTVLHFKIMNEANNSIVYQVDYSMSSPAITNAEGIVLFRKEANLIFIKSATLIPLIGYLYQITTEDSQGIVSEIYSDFK